MCQERDQENKQKIEQQAVEVTGKVLSHNERHRLYFVNSYNLNLPKRSIFTDH